MGIKANQLQIYTSSEQLHLDNQYDITDVIDDQTSHVHPCLRTLFNIAINISLWILQ
jgi:hypothetical protein